MLWAWAATNSATLAVALVGAALLSAQKQVAAAVGAVKQDVSRLEQAVAARKRAVPLSGVSQTEAQSLLAGTQLTLLVGELGELQAARGRRCVALPPFVWDPNAGEAAGTPAALQHLQAGLQQLGVRFGRGGYSLLDMHTRNTSLSFCVGDKLFTGGVDGVVVPYSVAPLSAVRHARVVVELETRKNAGVELGDRAIGQCIAELIGVSTHAVHPCLLLLTDGTSCDVLRLRGAFITRWAGVSLADALAYVADFLTQHSSSTACEFTEGDAERLEPHTARTMQRLRQLCTPPGALPGLAEQLESLAAADGVDEGTEDGHARRAALATELVGQWRHAMEPHELPQHIQHLFA